MNSLIVLDRKLNIDNKAVSRACNCAEGVPPLFHISQYERFFPQSARIMALWRVRVSKGASSSASTSSQMKSERPSDRSTNSRSSGSVHPEIKIAQSYINQSASSSRIIDAD